MYYCLRMYLKNFEILANYELDPACYFTAPGLAYDPCLKKTGLSLELLTYPDMLLMSERGIRGGVSMITKRYAKANNKYMKKYNPKKDSKFITYLDANNQYGWAMSKKLPTHGFKWMNTDDLNNCDSFPRENQVDLEYPESFHDKHNPVSKIMPTTAFICAYYLS